MKTKNNVSEIFEIAANFYSENLLMPECQPAWKYLTDKRNRFPGIIESQRLGCVNGRVLHKHLREKGFDDEAMLVSGLVRSKNEKLHDFFWKKNSVIYPVLKRGKPIDFYVKDYLTPKDSSNRADYQLSGDYKLEDPLFYGEYRFQKKVMLVEGQEDRNSVLQHYWQDDMAVLGSFGQLSEDQLSYLKKNLKRDTIVYLAFDRDKAGLRYSWRTMEALKGICNVQVVIWPEDFKDVDEYLRSLNVPINELTKMQILAENKATCENHEELKEIEDEIIAIKKEHSKHVKELLDTSQDAVIWWINTQIDLENADGREDAILEPVLKIISQESGALTRVTYIDRLSQAVGYNAQKKTILQKMIQRLAIPQIDPNLKKESGIMERNNCYYYVNDKGEVRISNFVLKIQRIVMEEDEMHYEVRIIGQNGESPRDSLVLSPDDQTNWRKFKRAVKAQGKFHYFGDDRQLSEMIMDEEIQAGDVPKVYKIKRYGWVKKHKMWLFDNCCIKNGKLFASDLDGVSVVDGIGYQSVNVNIYGGDRPKLNLEHKADKKFIHNVIEKFWEMWDGYQEKKPFESFKGWLAIAYVAAMAYRPELTQRVRRFPNLFSFGPVETGKSEVVKLIMNCFGFTHEGISWKNTSVVGMTNCLEQLSCIPLWMEEYINSHGRDGSQDSKVAIVREAFTLSAPTKGSLGNKNVSHEVNTSFVISGQDYFTDKAAQSRTITLRKEKPSDLASKAYFELVEMSDKLSSILIWLLENKTPETVKRFHDNYDETKSHIKEAAKLMKTNVSDRTLFNYSLLVAAFKIFDYKEHEIDFLDWITDSAVSAKKMENEADIVHRFFEDISPIYNGNVTGNLKLVDVIKYDFKEREIYLAIHQIYTDWQKLGRSGAHQEFISEDMLKNYFKYAQEGYWKELKDTRVNFSGSIRRSICLKVEKLPDDLQETVKSWVHGPEFND